MHHEKELKKKRRRRRWRSRKLWRIAVRTIARATKAIADLNLKLCKDPRTINHHLSREVVPGADVRILTDHEKKTLVKYLIKRN